MDTAAVALRKESGIVQTETETPYLPALGRIDLIKLFKDLGQLGWRNSDPGILHLDPQRAIDCIGAEPDLLPFWREFDGILQNCAQDKRHPLAIELNVRQG